MHTVVFGWFGASAVWFIPLLWRLVRSALPGGAGLRGPGTIRLWLGFVCVMVASCTLEGSLVGASGWCAIGHAFAAGFGRLLGHIGTPLAALVLFLISLPWLIDFRWRDVAVWADGAFGLGLSRGLAKRDEDARRHRADDGLPSHGSPVSSASNTMAPGSNRRYARPTVWRPPANARGSAGGVAGAAAGQTAAAAKDRPVRSGAADWRAGNARARGGVAGQAEQVLRTGASAPVRQASSQEFVGANAHTNANAAANSGNAGKPAWLPTEPVAPAGWLRESTPAARAPTVVLGSTAGVAAQKAAARDSASPVGRRSVGEQRTVAATGGLAAGALGAAGNASAAGVGAAAADAASVATHIAAARTAAQPITTSQTSSHNSTSGATASRPIAAGRPVQPRQSAAPAPAPGVDLTRPTPRSPASTAPSFTRPLTGTQTASPPESVQETLRSIAENAARWTDLAGVSLARSSSAESAKTATAPLPVEDLSVAPASTPAASEPLSFEIEPIETASPPPLPALGETIAVAPWREAPTPPSLPVDPPATAEAAPIDTTTAQPIDIQDRAHHDVQSDTLLPSEDPVAHWPIEAPVTESAPVAVPAPLPLPTPVPQFVAPVAPTVTPTPFQSFAAQLQASDMQPDAVADAIADANLDADANTTADATVSEAELPAVAAASIETPASAGMPGTPPIDEPADHLPSAATSVTPWPVPNQAPSTSTLSAPATPSHFDAPTASTPTASTIPTITEPAALPVYNETPSAPSTPSTPSTPNTLDTPPPPDSFPQPEALPPLDFPAPPPAPAIAERAPLRGHGPTNGFEFHAPAASMVELPTLDLLALADTDVEPVSEEKLIETGLLIEQRLQEFKVPVTVVGHSAGPVITRFEIEPALGVRGSQIVGLMKDLSRGLGLTSIRVVETIPGKTCMGLELPNAKRQTIRLSEILEASVYQNSHSQLTLAMGKDITGHPVVADLAKAPHMLVAGTTGSGKSVAINAMICSLLFKATPEEVRLIMIDPKMLELSVYEGIPHLLAPVVTDMKLAANALNWCVGEMEKRYRLMSAVGVRNLAGFNQKIRDTEARGKKLGNPFSLTPDAPEPLAPLPLIVVVIDELADLMMVAGKKIEELIARLAQKARAAGIHLILATQRPSVDVITGLIKANIPTRVAFQVSSKIDSRTILDQMGAESLLGQGDMLFLPPGTGYPQRVHGAFVADEEVHRIVEYLKQFGEPQYEEGILDGPATDGGAAQDLFGDSPEAEADPLYDEAVAFVVRTRRASISSVQRQLRIGYNRAARLVEQMETAGLVSAMGINGSREVLAPGPAE